MASARSHRLAASYARRLSVHLPTSDDDASPKAVSASPGQLAAEVALHRPAARGQHLALIIGLGRVQRGDGQAERDGVGHIGAVHHREDHVRRRDRPHP